MRIKDKLFFMLQSFPKSIFTGFFMAFAFCVNSQITNGNVNPEDEKKEDSKKEKEQKDKPVFNEDSLTGTDFFITGLYQYSYRSLEDQSLNNYYKEWENQTSSYNGGINLGLILGLTENLKMDIGFSYFGNGEKYTYADSLTDSTYAYTNTYRQVAIPIHLRYVYGKKFQVFAFAGLAPVNILKIRYVSDYRTENGTPVVPDVDIQKDGFVTFNLMFTGGIGIQYNMGPVGFTLYPEYRRHLMNTYADKVVAVKHNMYAIGLNAGFVFRF